MIICFLHSTLYIKQRWSWSLHAMSRHGGHGLQFHANLYSALDTGKCCEWRSGCVNPYPPHWSRSYTNFLTGSLEGLQRVSADFERKIFSCKRVLNYDCSHVNLVPKLLYRLSYPECHMLVYYLC